MHSNQGACGASRASGRNRGRCGISGLGRGVPAGEALLGWTIGRNVRIDTRWAGANADDSQTRSRIAALAPDVILATGASTVGPLLQATRTVPIVFPFASDLVAAGFVRAWAAGRQRHRLC